VGSIAAVGTTTLVMIVYAIWRILIHLRSSAS
jgi:hypothetical protein